MAKGPRYRVHFRRRREGKTDYRLRFWIARTSKLRFVVRKTLNHIFCSITKISLQGDETLVCAHSKELSKYGWKHGCGNLPASYLVGFLCGKKALAKGLKEAAPDFGIQRVIKGSRIIATLYGARDAGLDIPLSEEILPPLDRIKGEHISSEISTEFDKVKVKIEAI
ncbi:MAG: 50S ribosomal protein L18 [Candidatus Methanofastidiosia archaeon]